MIGRIDSGATPQATLSPRIALIQPAAIRTVRNAGLWQRAFARRLPRRLRSCWRMAHCAQDKIVGTDRGRQGCPAGEDSCRSIASRRMTVPERLRPETFPLAMCTFPGGLCGAVHRDGSVAVPPRYDWVGTFSDNRAAVRVGGLYGFVDEEGREVVRPQYRIVDDYKFGFAQVDVDGKSGLIDRDGKMVIEPKYGFIQAIARDRFAVSERRQLGGMTGGEDFSGTKGRVHRVRRRQRQRHWSVPRILTLPNP